jgi:signal transduction histidine kinase
MSSSDEKRTERLAYLGALVGAMVHEISNPISTIGMNLQLLAETWEGVEGEKARWTRRRLEMLQKETKRLEEILGNYRKITKGEAFSFALHDLNAIIEETLDFFAPSAQAKHIVIHRGLTPSLPQVLVDQGLIKQALTNLLKNAREALGETGGEIIVRTAADAECVQVDIADTGHGIEPEKLGRIFEPYFTTKQTGSGIGLATTKRIIEDHNGTIGCQSEVGKGTNFTVRIPLPAKP